MGTPPPVSQDLPEPADERGRSASRQGLKRVAGSAGSGAVALLLALVVLEGLSSITILAYELIAHRGSGLPSRAHMQPDSLLGWISRPGTVIPDMFGAGVDVRFNSRSFRGAAEYDPLIPEGRIRVLCSGDSFTFGYGVSDEQSWCARLQALDSRLETANLGHSGWGVDQAYLFYRRDGLDLQHDVHIFAFIPDDVRRVRLKEFVAYPKPYFSMENGEPVLGNVPVPNPSPLRLWFTYNENTIMRARSVEAGSRLAARVLGSRTAARETSGSDARAIVLHLIEDLQRISIRDGTILLVVLLEENLTSSSTDERLSRFLSDELAQRGISFIDLWSVFRQLPAEQLAAMFDPRWNHYSVEGNEMVARVIYRHLESLIADRAAERNPE